MQSFVMVLPPHQYDNEALRRQCEANGWTVVRDELVPTWTSWTCETKTEEA